MLVINLFFSFSLNNFLSPQGPVSVSLQRRRRIATADATDTPVRRRPVPAAPCPSGQPAQPVRTTAGRDRTTAAEDRAVHGPGRFLWARPAAPCPAYRAYSAPQRRAKQRSSKWRRAATQKSGQQRMCERNNSTSHGDVRPCVISSKFVLPKTYYYIINIIKIIIM